MEYTYDTLNRIVNDAERQAKTNKLKPEAAQFAAAAAYAIDFMDIGRDTGNALDLTILSEESVLQCLIAAHAANMRAGKTVAESRENLIKLFAGYELFAIANSMNIENKAVEIVVLRSVMSPEIKLVIDTLPRPDGKTYRFDVYDAVSQTVSEFQLGNIWKGDDVLFAGRILTFHNRLHDELLSKIVEEV